MRITLNCICGHREYLEEVRDGLCLNCQATREEMAFYTPRPKIEEGKIWEKRKTVL